jgi:hypothetical protein
MTSPPNYFGLARVFCNYDFKMVIVLVLVNAVSWGKIVLKGVHMISLNVNITWTRKRYWYQLALPFWKYVCWYSQARLNPKIKTYTALANVCFMSLPVWILVRKSIGFSYEWELSLKERLRRGTMLWLTCIHVGISIINKFQLC